MSSINLSDLYNSPNTGGVYSPTSVNSIAPSKDALYEPYASVYGADEQKEIPATVKDYLLQLKSYSDALSAAVSSLMQQELDKGNERLREIGNDNTEPVAEERAAQTNTVDLQQAKSALNKLVESYNSLLKFSGDFEKDPGFEKLHNRLTTLTNSYGAVLGEAGIYARNDGSLELNEARVDEVISSGRLPDILSGSGESDSSGFAKYLSVISEKGVAEPFSYMNDNTPHKAGGEKSGREYLKIMDTYNTKGMIFDTKQ